VERPDGLATDGDNRLLWRMNRRRLTAEQTRDAMLSAARSLSLVQGGPPFQPFRFEDDHSPRYLYDGFDHDQPSSWRRSLYRFVVRSVPEPLMTALDCADPSISVERRHETMTPLHALAMLNDEFVLSAAVRMADAVQRRTDDPGQQITTVFCWALQRQPAPDESAVLLELLAHHGLAQVCRTVMNLNEFVYVD
jgi:hypothetical protein